VGAATGFELESTRYSGLYSQSVNSYIAIKENGKAKRKGPLSNPLKETPPDLRTQMMTSPSMNVCADAVVAWLTQRHVPVEETIRARDDIRDFVTVVKVEGGGTWRGKYLGKYVRFIWSKDGDPILSKKAHATTGNHKKVPQERRLPPVMVLPDELPIDIDYDRYIAEAREILLNIGADRRPPPPVKIRVYAAQRLRLAGRRSPPEPWTRSRPRLAPAVGARRHSPADRADSVRPYHIRKRPGPRLPGGNAPRGDQLYAPRRQADSAPAADRRWQDRHGGRDARQRNGLGAHVRVHRPPQGTHRPDQRDVHARSGSRTASSPPAIRSSSTTNSCRSLASGLW
jgi:hypothetical protein